MKKSAKGWVCAVAVMILSCSAAFLSGCSGLVSSASNPPPPSTLDITNVQAASITTSASQVVWTTNVPANSSVDYGTTTAYGNSTPVDSTMVTSHQMTLSGLAAGTTYYYQVNSTDSKGNNGHHGNTFKTAGFSMSGTITPTAGGNGATVALSGAASAFATADSSGNYTIAGLPNGTYTVAPSHTGFTFTPGSQSMAVNGTNVTGVNFTATAVAVAPTITAQPASQTVIAGQTASFSVVASGTAPLSYQWQKNSVNIAGATSASYTTPATTTSDSGSTFAVVVSNTTGTVTSSAATLTVNTATVAPTITTQPANQTVTAGQTAAFTVVAGGTAPLSYQWQKNSVNITGATSASYTTPTTTISDSGSTFAVVVSNTTGTVTSATATLTVNAAAVAPTITTQPVSQTVTAGQTAAFTVVAGGTAPLTYQWQKNSVNITGATSANYTTPATTTADSNSTFRVVVTNTAGTVTSSTATLTVNAAAVAPTITTQPANQTVTAGQTAAFTAVAGGTAPLSYQWQKNSVNITGATSASYATPATTTSDSGSTFRVVVTNTAGTVTSSAATLTVNTDTVAPTVPTGLTATAISSSQINLSWTASTDNVGVTGYNIFRGGAKVGTAPSTSFQDAGLNASTSYTYTVSAFDAAGNTSAQSAAASATTQAGSSGGGIPSALGWYQIPNTAIRPLCPPYSDIQGVQGCPSVMSTWSGGLFDTKRDRQVIFGGGHTAYYGNEVYAIDLAANPIAPLLLRDASHGTAIANLSTCPEAYSDGTPSSRHTYSGLLYLANIDRYFAYGGSKAPCGYFANGVWFFDPNTASWALQSTNAGPNPAQNGSVPQAAYDSVTGTVFSEEENGGAFWQFNPTNSTWTRLANSSACGSLNMMAAIDPVRRLYFCVGSGNFFKVSLTAPYTATALTGTNCGPLTTTGGPGFAYDPVQKLLVGWVGGNTAYLYNPDTDSCTSATYSGGPTTVQSLGTFGRFAYSPALGVFVVSNSVDTNAYSLRLTSSGGTPPSGPVISAISVTGITTTGATVAWTTDVPATSQLEYGTTTAYGTTTTLDTNLLTAHAVALTGLSTGTLYHYRVHSKNSSGVESISSDAAFSTNSTTDTTPPTVSLTAPASGTTVSGTTTVSANATDNVGVASVQFSLDGANLGPAVTASPFQISWDTTTATNGAHTLSAVARDAAGNIGNAPGVSVTVSNSTSTALQDFQTRCAQTGVIVCQGFDDSTIFAPATYPASGIYVGASAAYATYDPTVSASGSGSLKFTIPSLAGPGDSGYWRQLLTSNLAAGPSSAQMFGANSTFYVQFRQRFSPEFLTNQWPANGGGTTWWKQEIFSNNASTCGQVEITTINAYNRGFPEMYSQCGADPFEINLNNGDYLLEQGDTSTTGYNCHYQTANNGPTSCFMYPSNTWVTFYYKVSIGNWGQPNSSILAWVSVGGQPYKEWINITNHVLNEDVAGADYNMVTLLPYMTQRNSSVSAGPTAYTWYDELIVSSSPIAAPNN